MKIFEDLIPEEKQHYKYKLLKNSFSGDKEILQDWVKGFEDRDGKIIKEFQATFHSAFWEFYLFAVFKEAGFKINFDHNRPDFIVTSPEEVYIEAVVSNIKQSGRKEEDRTLDDQFSMLTPSWEQDNFLQELDESIIRHSNAILSKSNKCNEDYKNLSYVKSDVPYVVALGAFEQVNYGNQFYYPMMALLYGYYYDPKTNNYSIQETVKKPNTETKIPIGIFCNEKNKHISAIIFSSTVTLGKLMALSLSQNKSLLQTNYVLGVAYQDELPHFCVRNITPANPEFLSDGLFIFHNPFAENKLGCDFLGEPNATHIFIDENKNLITQRYTPMLYSRFNTVKIPDEYIELIVLEEYIHFNHRDVCFIQGEFKVLEIDYDFKEVTLHYNNLPVPTIIDLTDHEVIYFKEINLKVTDRIEAIVFSIPESNGNTEQFKFLTNIRIKS